MDAETRAYLDEALSAVRRDFAELRGEVSGLRGEVSGLGGEVGGLRGEVTELRDEVGELRIEVRQTAVEMRRHFGVTAEALRHDIQVVAEGLVMTNETVARLGIDIRAEMDERFRIHETVMRVAFGEVRRDIDELRARL